MAEKIFNLFLFIENDIVVELGGKFHKRDGSEEEQLSFLQSQIEEDFKSAKRFKVSDKSIYCVVFLSLTLHIVLYCLTI